MLGVQTEKKTLSRYSDWRADHYIGEYYNSGLQVDDYETLRFQIDFLKKQGVTFSHALEFGCGPTLLRAIAAAPYVNSLDMADSQQDNLTAIKKWVDENDRRWSAHTEFALRCEGLAATTRDVENRELLTKTIITNLCIADARKRHPLGHRKRTDYDLLITGFCLECISNSRDTWLQCMENVFSLLKSEGGFVLAALANSDAYRVGDRWFPSTNIDIDDLREALYNCGCDESTLNVQKRCLANSSEQGFDAILLASGRLRQ